MVEKLITYDLFVQHILVDEISKRPETDATIQKLVLQPDMTNREENYLRRELLKKFNGAVGDAVHANPKECVQRQLTYDEFLEIEWCPKGKASSDYADHMSNHTRKLKAILAFLKDPRLIKKLEPLAQKEVEKELPQFFKPWIPEKDKKHRRIYIFEFNGRKVIIDGCHRTGSILAALAKDAQYEPVDCSIAKFS